MGKILSFTSNDIEFVSGTYYSPEFMADSKDQLLTVQATLSTTGIINVQCSIDGEDWSDVVNSEFSCTPTGVQSYKEIQEGLSYRLKSSTKINKIKILI